jgi:hypothetical protein
VSEKRLSFGAIASAAGRDVVSHPSYCVPALLLLTPTLVLQLAGPTYLRSRLAPAIWTVLVGAVLLIWLGQIAAPAVSALVRSRRAGTRRRLDWPLVRLSAVIGTRVTLGLAAGLVPGLWLQARYAFAPLALSPDDRTRTSTLLKASAEEGRQALGRLLLVAGAALVVSALGQSAIAALAEVMSTIAATGQENGRTVFQLHFLPHALTSIAAYVWSATTLTFHAVCVSVLFDDSRGVQALATRSDAGREARWRRVGQVTAAAFAAGAMIAAAYKIEQHIN